jgi:hypothetical protein
MTHLDEALRRRDFVPPAEKIFAAIATLPFMSPNFVSADLPTLLFCSIVGCLHATKEVVDNVRLFLDSAMQTLEASVANSSLAKHRMRMSKLLANSKTIDPIAVIDTGYRVADSISESVRTSFLKLITESEPAENLDIWCIKAAASVQFNGGDFEMCLKYVENLPKMFRSKFGSQKLALGFTSLGHLIDKFPSTSKIPILYIWSALLSMAHSNQRLRAAATELLAVLMPFALDNGSLKDIEASRRGSPAIGDAVQMYEREIRVDFAKNFSYAFSISLKRVMEEIETRKSALDLLKTCLTRLVSNQSLAVYFTLPFVAFAQEDPQWILMTMHSSCQTIAEFIFKDFETRRDDEMTDIIEYLAEMFGERHCAHRVELLADCLIFGSRAYPHIVGKCKRIILEKCWKMLASEASQTKIEKIATVCAAFCVVPWPKMLLVQGRSWLAKFSDETLATVIGNTVDGIAQLAKAKPR